MHKYSDTDMHKTLIAASDSNTGFKERCLAPQQIYTQLHAFQLQVS